MSNTRKGYVMRKNKSSKNETSPLKQQKMATRIKHFSGKSKAHRRAAFMAAKKKELGKKFVSFHPKLDGVAK